MKARDKIEFGDFQTPLGLAREVCVLIRRLGVEADVVMEPTCGQGSFLVAAAELYPQAKLFGWDINAEYVQNANTTLSRMECRPRATVAAKDFFSHNWQAELAGISGNVLILGNPPWVTNAVVSGLAGGNLPAKENFQGFRGIVARTGKSNFDISEWMLICLLKALRGRSATIAMLCKTATARKALRFAWQNDGRVASASLFRIDAKAHFGAAVDACLLLAKTGSGGPAEAEVFDSLAAAKPAFTFGLAGQDLVRDVQTYHRLRHLEGLCPYQWRSGVKHDCSAVMEISRDANGALANKLGERIEIEPDHLFPLLKCTDLAHGRSKSERYVLVTQRRVGENTAGIALKAPRTWAYLQSHRSRFGARKSSIYAKGVQFAIFGIGDYTFAPWKVAISALHRSPRFTLVGPHDDKPVLFDDTCNFISFEDEGEAEVVAAILNSTECREFLEALTFTDSKRPITVELLQRLNVRALAEDAGLLTAWENARSKSDSYPSQPVCAQGELIMEQPSR